MLLAVVLIGSLLTPARAFTTGQSASLVIGQNDFTANAPGFSQTKVGVPAASAFDAAGNLWIADQGGNRVLMFKPPFTNGKAASLVIGQADFTSTTPDTNQTRLRNPYGLAFDASGKLWIADKYNNRTLMFKPPFTNGMAASLVIGQPDFTTNTASTSQSGFHGPQSLSFDAAGNLWVTDQRNNRILMFKPPFINGMLASIVIGQADFTHSSATTTQTGLSNPAGLGLDTSGDLWVADFNNYRILMFKPPFTNGMLASLVIGQTTFTTGIAATTQTGLRGPYGLSFDASGNLWVSDAANNRVLKFNAPFTNGMPASLVIGQPDFTSSAPALTQTGFDFPTSSVLDALGNLWVVDASNYRVLMFAGSSGLSGFLLELQPGWNLISLPLIPKQTSTAKLLAPLIQVNDLVTVWGFTPPNTWSYFKPPNLGTLTSMVDGKGYWVLVTDAINITVVGYVITPGSAPPTYSLAAGWNLAGFKPQPLIQNETMATYLTSLDTKYSSIWVYDSLNATWIRGTPSLELAPGEGMWIYMTTPATLLP